MNSPIIICKNITKSYGKGDSKVNAVSGVNLVVTKGEIRLLMGPSGSGKTTLVSIISGVLTQDSGEYLINDVDLNHLPDKKRTRFRGKNIGFVFQSFNLVPTLTVEENISIPLLIRGENKIFALEKAKELLTEVGIESKIGSFPPQLSGGQQQIVAICRAMIHSPPLIVCDEPTSFLDHELGLKIMKLLKNMVNKIGATLVIVTHDPRIVQFADKIDNIEDGKIRVEEGLPHTHFV
jgi:putative ABC transport system ATP-binding protein